MRIIAVGDDDQNIFEFRGSDSKYLYQLTEVEGSRFVEMTENFRSGKAVVDFANTFSSRIQGRLKQMPIVSMCPWTGAVTIHRFSCPNMYLPLVRDLVSRPADGKVGLLTQTNEEAVILLALLRSRGINAKLIQSADGFHFGALAEVRYFMRALDSSVSSPIIPDDIWDMSKKRLFDKYASSSTLPYLRHCLEVFEDTNRKKYYTDFKEFIFESELEDFCETAGADVTVSTIHKSKGREYDEVYMLLAGNFNMGNEQLRRYYVGMTRAKKDLHIYTNSSCFDRQKTSGQRLFDAEEYPLPDEVVLQLTHKDVVLSFFTSRKKEVLSLVGGDPLAYSEDYLLNTKSGKPVVKLSARKRESLRLWEERGYHVKSAAVRFVVAWKEKDADQNQPETAVLLPELTLIKVTT